MLDVLRNDRITINVRGLRHNTFLTTLKNIPDTRLLWIAENHPNSPDYDPVQSWTKVLGTVLQYSDFSVISLFPLKTVHPFRNFPAVLLPPTLYKVETRKKFRIQASNIVCGVTGGVGPV